MLVLAVSGDVPPTMFDLTAVPTVKVVVVVGAGAVHFAKNNLRRERPRLAREGPVMMLKAVALAASLRPHPVKRPYPVEERPMRDLDDHAMVLVVLDTQVALLLTLPGPYLVRRWGGKESLPAMHERVTIFEKQDFQVLSRIPILHAEGHCPLRRESEKAEDLMCEVEKQRSELTLVAHSERSEHHGWDPLVCAASFPSWRAMISR